MGRGRQGREGEVGIPCVGFGMNVPWLVYSSIVRASECVSVEE